MQSIFGSELSEKAFNRFLLLIPVSSSVCSNNSGSVNELIFLWIGMSSLKLERPFAIVSMESESA